MIRRGREHRLTLRIRCADAQKKGAIEARTKAYAAEAVTHDTAGQLRNESVLNDAAKNAEVALWALLFISTK